MAEFYIQEKPIGENHPCFFIAEISANHLQDLNRALKLIDEAKNAGADAVKFQTYRPDTITFPSSMGDYRLPKENPYGAENLFELYKTAYLPWEWHRPLAEKAKSKNIIFFSTPFDETAVDLLEELNVPAYKIASFEIVDIPLIRKAGLTGKPVIVSTGMANWGEIEECVQTLKKTKNSNYSLLRCVSAYPAKPEEFHLRDIPLYSELFNAVPGLSDHQLGNEMALGAVALGAKIIEKHFTLSRDDGGPDASFSLEPKEFSQMVHSVRILEKALKKKSCKENIDENKNLKYRPSIIIVKDISKGEVITAAHISTLRPNVGLSPKELPFVIGKKVKNDLKQGMGLKKEDIDW